MRGFGPFPASSGGRWAGSCPEISAHLVRRSQPPVKRGHSSALSPIRTVYRATGASGWRDGGCTPRIQRYIYIYICLKQQHSPPKPPDINKLNVADVLSDLRGHRAAECAEFGGQPLSCIACGCRKHTLMSLKSNYTTRFHILMNACSSVAPSLSLCNLQSCIFSGKSQPSDPILMLMWEETG